MSNPHLSQQQRTGFVSALMIARRKVRSALRQENKEGLLLARAAVHSAKQALGERGAPWWTDSARDFNRHLVKNTPYAEWFDQLALSQD